MRVLMAVAVVLLATSAAEAQYSFEYDGRTIRIDPDRGTVSIPGIFDNTPKKAKRARTDPGTDRARQQTKRDPQGPDQTAPASSPQPVAPQNPAPATAAAPTNAATTTNTAPTETAAIPPKPVPAPPAPPSPPLAPETAPAAAAAPSAATTPATVTTAPPPRAPKPAENAPAQPQAPTPAAGHDANSPIGVWLTEEKEGKVRIEPCGTNLCGYSVDAKSNQNAEQVLINMKRGKDEKWSGRILDPNTGSTYDSTIGLIGANALRVQGCAFGGMFCGGQTWTRVN
jgi:uncharacterized protein (DUF2147 family)